MMSLSGHGHGLFILAAAGHIIKENEQPIPALFHPVSQSRTRRGMSRAFCWKHMVYLDSSQTNSLRCQAGWCFCKSLITFTMSTKVIFYSSCLQCWFHIDENKISVQKCCCHANGGLLPNRHCDCHGHCHGHGIFILATHPEGTV